ncbi:MAG: hypothetical protein FD181_3248 [Prolixibacteraceae bacterium]|nr:MAG: hypothetical protein FD181_3248 [Prolixibacteraceae bacterium]
MLKQFDYGYKTIKTEQDYNTIAIVSAISWNITSMNFCQGVKSCPLSISTNFIPNFYNPVCSKCAAGKAFSPKPGARL